MNLRIKSTDFSVDPVEVFERVVGQHENCFLLETLFDEDQPQTSGQSYIGVAPEHHFAAKGGRFYSDGKQEQVDNPCEALRSKMHFSVSLPAHYVGGLVGYFSHEAMQ